MALGGLALVSCIIALNGGFAKRDPMAAKIKAIQERRHHLQRDSTSAKRRKKPEASVSFMRSVVTRFQLLKSSQIEKTQELLIEAGFRSKDAIYILSFFNLVTPIVLSIVGVVYMRVHASTEMTLRGQILNYIWPILGAYIGLKFPNYYVSRVRSKRYYSIQKALADTLDLMTICAEAGLSLAVMLERVSKELAITYPEIAQELLLTSIEIGFLPDRNKALSNLAERCKMPEIKGITSVLIQTEKYGTPIAQALRVLSKEFREARMLRAEQKAARLPALMTVPMILFILPTLFIVIIAPSAVRLIDSLASK